MGNRGHILSVCLLLACCLPASTQNNGANQNSPAEHPNLPSNPEQPLQSNTVETFTGKITRHGNEYVLYDMPTNLVFKLDNQDEAKKYFGKDVSVVGQLLSPGSTIHVNKIVRAK